MGLWQYTAEFDDLLAVDAAGTPVQRRTNRGVYAFGDVALIPAQHADHGDAPPRLSAFVRVGMANGDLNRFDRYLGAGLVLRGLIGEDELGIAIARAYAGDAYRSLTALAGTPSDRVESNIELTWSIPVTDWLVVQSDVQYIINPGTDPRLRDALVVGLQFVLTGERAW